MPNLLFINYGRTHCLKVYEHGYILFEKGVFSFAEKYDDEFYVTASSLLPSWSGSMKQAFIAYCQIMPNREVALRLLTDFRNKENLKFLQLVADANTGETFSNPKTSTKSCAALPTAAQISTSGIYVATFADSTFVSSRAMTLSLQGIEWYQKLFTIYFSLYLMGIIVVDNQISNNQGVLAQEDSSLHLLLTRYVRREL